MMAHTPTGIYDLTVLFPVKHLEAVKQMDFVKKYGLTERNFNSFENNQVRSISGVKHAPYAEMQIDNAEILDVISGMIQGGVEADFQVEPLYQDEKYVTSVEFNVYLRNKNGVVTCYTNGKELENAAYELTILLNELNEKGIHEADEHIVSKINSLHNLGWVC